MEKIAFVFPGQGSQYVGMSKKFYDNYSAARHTFEEANEILGFELSKICFEGDFVELLKIENSLLAVFVSSVAAFRVYMKEIGIPPQVCAGHSLGEYSALVCSNTMKFSDALKMVDCRARLAKQIADYGTGAMTIIDGTNADFVEMECRKVSSQKGAVNISCYNSFDQVAISGYLDPVQAVEDAVLEMGGQVTPLISSAPFHSSLMQPIADELEKELLGVKYSPFEYPVISNVSAEFYGGPSEVVNLLKNQILQPVQWVKTMKYLEKIGVTLAIEIGPRNILCNLLKTCTPGLKALSFDLKEDREEINEILKHKAYKKYAVTVVKKCMDIAVSAPNKNKNNFEYKNYVVKPYKRMKAIQEHIEIEGKRPSKEQEKEAIELLKLILSTKGIIEKEQLSILEGI